MIFALYNARECHVSKLGAECVAGRLPMATSHANEIAGHKRCALRMSAKGICSEHDRVALDRRKQIGARQDDLCHVKRRKQSIVKHPLVQQSS
jgi:hypothetical protein